jgi:hypothetical protein
VPDLKDMNNLYMIAAFVVPGLVITYVRSQFISGRMEKISDAVLVYFALTIIYWGMAIPFVFFIIQLGPGVLKLALWWSIIIVGPAIVGLLLGVSAQRGWIRWIAIKLRLRIVHGTPTSWDWRFANCPRASFVMVTLADGSTVAGIFGTGSFASTEPTERDLYIEEIMDVADDGSWVYRKEVSGILITAKEIRFVEFKGEL